MAACVVVEVSEIIVVAAKVIVVICSFGVVAAGFVVSVAGIVVLALEDVAVTIIVEGVAGGLDAVVDVVVSVAT